MPDSFRRLQADPEFSFLCQILSDYAQGSSTDEPAEHAPDWRRLIRLSEAHGVAPLLHAQAGTLVARRDAEAARYLKQIYRLNALTAMRTADETARIREALASGGLATHVLKGLPLARRLYRNAADRHCGDVDLLLDDAIDWQSAQRCMVALGYVPQVTPDRLPRHPRSLYFRMYKDMSFSAREGDLKVELHWHSPQVPLISAGFVQALRELGREGDRPGSTAMESLSAEKLLVYLAGHGSHSRWVRLKWIADVLLLRDVWAADASSVLALAREWGTDRHVEVMLALMLGIYGWGRPEAVPSYAAALARSCASVLQLSDMQSDPMRCLVYWLRLERNPAVRKAMLLGAYFRLEDCGQLNLPPALLALLVPWRRLPGLVTRRIKALRSHS